VGVFLRLLDVMPLSKEQMDLLKDGSTPIQFAKDSPQKMSKNWFQIVGQVRTIQGCKFSLASYGRESWLAGFDSRF